jgi:hypothetical protein
MSGLLESEIPNLGDENQLDLHEATFPSTIEILFRCFSVFNFLDQNTIFIPP